MYICIYASKSETEKDKSERLKAEGAMRDEGKYPTVYE